MKAKLLTQAVGPWPMNTYVVICTETNISAIIDPGSDPDTILAMTEGTKVDKILLTHGHFDHVLALEKVKEATGAPVYLNPVDAEEFDVAFDVALEGGEQLPVGNLLLKAIHTPGHTSGQICFDLGDGRIIVGDTVFVGGPGKTGSAEDFVATMKTMQKIVFTWPDDTLFFPGHGPSGVIGVERLAFDAFVSRGWPEDLQGDVTWN
ncbi:MAG: MBL fold metallo-hydrolase [Anaerolineales bacterium]|nr:MBL fold metallo-hydrolase [Chloroflexota bacterium]MBL6979922.1 MBL fold metallo-hydrolase [Anaerolineales bacterium]